MTTYLNPLKALGGVTDSGPGFELVMEWHDAPNLGGFFGTGVDGTDFTPGTHPSGGTFTAVNPTNAHREYHYRFIPVPNPLLLNNPPIDTNIPFRLWNTYPSPDEATAAAITGSTFLTSDFGVGTDILDFEWLELNVRIAEGANAIDADLNGTFTQGTFTFDIVGSVTLVVEVGPNGSVGERWVWNTQVMTAWDSTEQRIQYMPHPIRSYEADYVIDQAEAIELQKLLLQATNGQLATPLWQMECFLTADTVAPLDRIYFSPENTNLRDGDQLYIVDNKGILPPLIVTIETMETDGATLQSGLPQDVSIGNSVYPLQSIFVENPQIRIDIVAGSYSLRGEFTDRNRPTARQGAVATVPLHNSLPVCDFKTREGLRENFQNFYDEVGTSFGQRTREGIWPAPRLLRGASFSVPRRGNMVNSYEKACVFFDRIAGQLKPFYWSSGLADLALFEAPSSGATQIDITDTDYASVFFPSEIYKSIEVTYSDNTYDWFRVNSVTAQSNGSLRLFLDDALPLNVANNPIKKISYLLRVRLASDSVALRHVNNRTIFSFSILGTDQ